MSAEPLEERLIYDVTTTDPRVLRGLTVVEEERRDLVLPTVYIYTDGVHPQLRNPARTADTGKAYVYLVDTSPAGSARAKDLASTVELPGGMINPPSGTNSTSYFISHINIFILMIHSPGLGGLFALNEGDAVFARDVKNGGDPEDDALQVFVATK